MFMNENGVNWTYYTTTVSKWTTNLVIFFSIIPTGSFKAVCENNKADTNQKDVNVAEKAEF